MINLIIVQLKCYTKPEKNKKMKNNIEKSRGKLNMYEEEKFVIFNKMQIIANLKLT